MIICATPPPSEKPRRSTSDYLKVYIHREDALEDMGVTEETLKPFAPESPDVHGVNAAWTLRH